MDEIGATIPEYQLLQVLMLVCATLPKESLFPPGLLITQNVA